MSVLAPEERGGGREGGRQREGGEGGGEPARGASGLGKRAARRQWAGRPLHPPKCGAPLPPTPPNPPSPPPALTRQLLHHLIKQPSEQVLKQCNLKAHPRVCDAPLALLPCLLGGRLATGALLVVVVLGGEGGGGGARLLSHQ